MKNRWFLFLLLFPSALVAQTVPSLKNFARVRVSTGYNGSATSIVLFSGDGARLPSTAGYYLVWWNYSDYPDPTDDPNREIVKVTARSSDTLTITRGHQGTSAATHNTPNKNYRMSLSSTS